MKQCLLAWIWTITGHVGMAQGGRSPWHSQAFSPETSALPRTPGCLRNQEILITTEMAWFSRRRPAKGERRGQRSDFCSLPRLSTTSLLIDGVLTRWGPTRARPAFEARGARPSVALGAAAARRKRLRLGRGGEGAGANGVGAAGDGRRGHRAATTRRALRLGESAVQRRGRGLRYRGAPAADLNTGPRLGGGVPGGHAGIGRADLDCDARIDPPLRVPHASRDAKCGAQPLPTKASVRACT